MQDTKFLIAGRKVSCNDSDRIFKLLYNHFTDEVHKEIDNYITIFERIVDSVNTVKLCMYIKFLESMQDKEEVDLRPYACEYRQKMKMDDYNFSLEKLDDVMNNIKQILWGFSTVDFMDLLLEQGNMFDCEYYEKVFDEYEKKARKDIRKRSIVASVASFTYDIDEMDEFNEYYNFLKPNLGYVDETMAQLKWRLKYKEKEKRKKLYDDLKYKCQWRIFDLIRRISIGCELKINPLFYDMDNYIEFSSSLYQMRKNPNSFSADQVVDNMLKFPINSVQYELSLEKIGDEDSQLSQFANFWGIDLELVKEKNIQKIVKKCETLNWKNDNDVRELYQYLMEKKGFFNYRKDIQIEAKLEDTLRTVNGKRYDTIEEADRVRERSFEGKEYGSKEEAEIVCHEVMGIRNKLKDPDFLVRYQEHQTLSKQQWITQEALEELEKADKCLQEEYQSICEQSEKEKHNRKQILISVVAGAIVTVLSTAFGGALGFIIFVICVVIIINKYKKWKKSKMAGEICLLMKTLKSDSQEIIQGEKRYCPRCGKSLEKIWIYCPYCNNE